MSPPPRIERNHAALAVIDTQERLLPATHQHERIVQNCQRLICGAAILGMPILATEQYPRGLGRTIPEIKAALGSVLPLEKTAFSACGAPGFLDALRDGKIKEVLLCGVEAHVCVSQTCLDLIAAGFEVFVVADAVSSRTPENCAIGLRRMEHAGAAIVSTEMALFELLQRAGTEEFKKILELVK